MGVSYKGVDISTFNSQVDFAKAKPGWCAFRHSEGWIWQYSGTGGQAVSKSYGCSITGQNGCGRLLVFLCQKCRRSPDRGAGVFVSNEVL